jgi:hypothetical protein
MTNKQRSFKKWVIRQALRKGVDIQTFLERRRRGIEQEQRFIDKCEREGITVRPLPKWYREAA